MDREKMLKSYKLDTDSRNSIKFQLQEMPDFFTANGRNPKEPHIHMFYQIIWFRHGHGSHFVDFKEYPVNDNTLFFLSPGQVHYFEENDSFDGYVIHFNEDFMSDEGSSENIFLKYNVFNAFDAVPYYNMTEFDTERLAYIIGEIKTELENEAVFAHGDVLKYLIKLFLIHVQRLGTRGTGIPLCINNSSNRIFVRFRQMLEHHYRDIHTVKEYASMLNVSTKTLTNCVYEGSHSTPLRLINDRIILEAKRQLMHSSLKIKEIAYYLGFNDPSYFIKFFKRQTGCLPAELRE